MHILFVITVVLLAIEVLHYLVFLVCRLFGYSVWLFPDINRDDKGLLGIFTPIISVEVCSTMLN